VPGTTVHTASRTLKTDRNQQHKRAGPGHRHSEKPIISHGLSNKGSYVSQWSDQQTVATA
jgi:hypothetical protein